MTTSASPTASRARSGVGTSSTWWPAAASMPWTWEPDSRSGTSATTPAAALLRAHAAELAPERLGHAPPVHDLGAALAHAEQSQVGGDAGVVEELHRAVDRVRRRGVAEAVGDDDPPVE